MVSQIHTLATHLEDTPDNAHDMVLGSLLLLGVELVDAGASDLLGNALADADGVLLAHASVDVDVLDLSPDGAVVGALDPAPAFPARVEEDEERAGEVGLEEAVGSEGSAADGVKGGVERCNEGDDVDENADVRAPDAAGGLVGQLVERVAVCFPGQAEADVGEANAAVDEEDGETGQRQEPVEDGVAVVCQVDECKATEQELHDDHVDGAALAVNLSEELGCHAWIYTSVLGKFKALIHERTIGSESLDGASGAVCARVGDTHNCNQDDSVEDGREDLDSGKLDGNDER